MFIINYQNKREATLKMTKVKRLGLELGEKFLRKGEEKIWAWDIIDDIKKYKKYDSLNAFEMLAVAKIAIGRIGEESEAIIQDLTEKHSGHPELEFL